MNPNFNSEFKYQYQYCIANDFRHSFGAFSFMSRFLFKFENFVLFLKFKIDFNLLLN